MEVGYAYPLPFPGGRLRIRPIIACVLLAAGASLSQFNPNPYAGGYGVVAAERQTYIWTDSLSPWDAGASTGYRLDLGRQFIYTPQQTNICLHGYYASSDYTRDYLNNCVMMADTVLNRFRFWDTTFFYFPVHKMLAGVLPDGQPAYIGYEMLKDTLSLSTIWVRLGGISVFVPGHWPMDTVAYFCRRAIARDSVLKTRTREDWVRDYEGSKITRFTWKLMFLPDAIAGSRIPEARQPLAPGLVDARGRQSAPPARNPSPLFRKSGRMR